MASNWYPSQTDLNSLQGLERATRTILDQIYKNSGSIDNLQTVVSKNKVPTSQDIILQIKQSLQSTGVAPINLTALLGINVGSFFTQGGNSFSTNAILGTKDTFALTFIVNNSEVFRASSAGKFLVGITAPVSWSTGPKTYLVGGTVIGDSVGFGPGLTIGNNVSGSTLQLNTGNSNESFVSSLSGPLFLSGTAASLCVPNSGTPVVSADANGYGFIRSQTVAQLNGTGGQKGNIMFCSDAKSITDGASVGSSIAGSGSGCMVQFNNSQWRVM